MVTSVCLTELYILVLQRERWMAKVPEPQAIQKLLHSRTNKLASPNNCINVDISRKSHEKANDDDDDEKNVLSKFWENRKKSSKGSPNRKQLITGVLPNKYQPEPVVTKIAFCKFYIFYFI